MCWYSRQWASIRDWHCPTVGQCQSNSHLTLTRDVGCSLAPHLHALLIPTNVNVSDYTGRQNIPGGCGECLEHITSSKDCSKLIISDCGLLTFSDSRFSAPTNSWNAAAFIITGPPNGQYSFARWRLSSSSVHSDNAGGGRAGRPPGAWMVGAPAAGRAGGRAADCTAGQYSYVPLGRHLVIIGAVEILWRRWWRRHTRRFSVLQGGPKKWYLSYMY